MMTKMECPLTGFTYLTKHGKAVRVLGYDGLFADTSRVLLEDEEGVRWGCETWRIEARRRATDHE